MESSTVGTTIKQCRIDSFNGKVLHQHHCKERHRTKQVSTGQDQHHTNISNSRCVLFRRSCHSYLGISILAYLSSKDYLTCKLVCRRWDALRHNVAIMRKAMATVPSMIAKTGDAFYYGPWGGKCIVTYTSEGCLWLGHDTNANNAGFRVEVYECR